MKSQTTDALALRSVLRTCLLWGAPGIVGAVLAWTVWFGCTALGFLSIEGRLAPVVTRICALNIRIILFPARALGTESPSASVVWVSLYWGAAAVVVTQIGLRLLRRRRCKRTASIEGAPG